jgi:SAM-dependent methyltransferase
MMSDVTNSPTISVGGFSAVDASDKPDDYVKWMTYQRRRGADRGLADLEAAPGSRILDVGCGPGVDVSSLRESGMDVVGIDSSVAMCVAANDRTGASVCAVADAAVLPFATATFDGVWSRALLLHTNEPVKVVAELSRVVRPGGRIVLSEPDHGTHVVSTSRVDVFEKLLAFRRKTFKNSLVGRYLPELAVNCGLDVVSFRAKPMVFRSLADARSAGGPFDVTVAQAVQENVISEADATSYLESLVALDAQGAFVFQALAFVLVARRSATSD